MNAMPMLVQGTIRVFDEKEANLVGLVFVSPLASPEGSQIQRWIMRDFQRHYRFRPWTPEEGAPESLGAWESMVSTPAPKGVTWGATPAQGLWVPGASYVVAQATPVIPEAGTVPTPKYPRSAAVAEHLTISSPLAAGPAGRSAPHGGRLPPRALDIMNRPWPQVVIGDYVLSQLDLRSRINAKRGYCFGDLVPEELQKQTFHASSEYALLYPEYLGAGSAGVTSLDPRSVSGDEKHWEKASEFHAHVVETYREGYRYEVTGCNYYRGTEPPPAWFL